MSGYYRITLTADPMSRTGGAELLGWLGRTQPGPRGQGAVDAGAISVRAGPGGLEFRGPIAAIEALLAQLRPSLDLLGITVTEPSWARDPGSVTVVRPDVGEPITLQ